MDEIKRNDDALFEALNKSKKRKKRRRLITVLAVLAVIVLAIVLAVNSLQKRVREFMSDRNDEVLNYTVTYGTVGTTVSGSGSIEDVDTLDISLPSGVEISEVLVHESDKVKEGDVLATVDMSTVLSALSQLQTQIEAKDKTITQLGNDSDVSTITAGVSGRIKKVYAEPGDDVAVCMVENGALALISIDGYMALDLECSELKAGDSVKVQRQSGAVLDGKVESVHNGVAVILVTDKGTELDEEVTVLNSDGSALGSAALYVHSGVNITGYTGTVKNVFIRQEQVVYAATGAFSLKDNFSGERYESTLKERQALEDDMLELLRIYRQGAICAPFDGTVLSVQYGKETTASSVSAQSALSAYAQTQSTASGSDSAILTLSRDKQMQVTLQVGESDILALEKGFAAEISIESIGEQVYTGTVTEIDRSAVSSASGSVYSATVTFDKAPHMLYGMTADVVITVAGTENVLIVPTDAVHKTSASAFVYLGYDEETGMFSEPRDISVGVSNKDYTEIRSGLEEGETVYYMKSEDPFAFMWGRG